MKPGIASGFLTALLLTPLASVSAGDNAKDNYDTYCVQCHGLTGDGLGVNVPDMSVQPRDHTDAQDMSSRSEQDLFDAIKGGGVAIGKSTLMPPWGDNLSDGEIHDLVAYLRELCQCQHGKAK